MHLDRLVPRPGALLGRTWSVRSLREGFVKTTPICSDTPHLCVAGTPANPAWTSWVFLAADQHGYLAPYQALSTRSLSYRRVAGASGDLDYRYTHVPSTPLTREAEDHRRSTSTRQAPLEPAAVHRYAMEQRSKDRARLDELEALFEDLDRRIDTRQNAASDAYRNAIHHGRGQRDQSH